MKHIALRRKDGKPLHAALDAVYWWMSSVEDPKRYTEISIGGKIFTLGMTFEEVEAVMRKHY